MDYTGLFSPSIAILVAFAAFALAAIVSLVLSANARLARTFGASFCFIGSIAGTYAGISSLMGATPLLSLGIFPLIGNLYFELGALSGFFALIVSFVGAAVTLYSFKYMAEYEEKGYNAGKFWFLLSLFILSMLAVVAAKNALLFMVAWEAMTLSSFFLVTHESGDEKVQKAGFTYLFIAHVGAAMLTLMFLILAGVTGSLDFANFSNIPQPIASVVFLLALFGFGSKAGIVPLHVWLPHAHPQAPSGISALMSGVMLKVAIFGFVMVSFVFLGKSSPPMWWGLLAIILGAVSALLGVLYALIQHDLKRMLAYHSIENVGIIFIGIGASLLFVWAGSPAFAALALFAALYHSLNPALFKSLLFMGAGSVIQSAHTKDIEKLGGLVKLMPITAVMFFIASYAISAVPPLNGFASELLTFQALIAGANSGGFLPLIFGAVAVSLALTSALALAAFVKVFGIVFLGLPRSSEAGHAKEVSGLMLVSMGILAVACIATGIFAGQVANLISPAILSAGLADTSLVQVQANALPLLELFVALLACGALIALTVYIFRKLFHAKNETKDTWGCGFYGATPQMQYTASGFSMPVMRIFGSFANFHEGKAHQSDFFEESFYAPIANAYVELSSHSNFLQTGQLSAYLLYIMITLGCVLIYAIM